MKTIIWIALHLSLFATGCDRAATPDDVADAPATQGQPAAQGDAAVEDAATADRSAAERTPGTAANPVSTRPHTARPRVVFLGDSLTAGMGVEADEAFPARVGEMLRDEGIDAHIVNAGVSGDTTAGGLRRLDWVLKQAPDVIVVGLGGNDGLRATDVKSSEQNLRDIVRKSRNAGAKVLLLGMLIPPNYGPEYTTQFREVYARVARDLKVPLVPFVLEGVGGDPRLNQRDGIHPTAEGQRIIARNVVPYLRDLLKPPASS